METFLILIIFALVIGIGFILSRPFVKMEESQEDIPTDKNPSPLPDTAKVEEKSVPLEATTQSEASTFCPKCGHRVKPNDKFCTYCGNRLQH